VKNWCTHRIAIWLLAAGFAGSSPITNTAGAQPTNDEKSPRGLGRPTPARSDAPNYSKLVHPGPDGKLVYAPDAQGGVIPDFSNCGYQGGGVALPSVSARLTVEPQAGGQDDLPRLQAAIDRVSRLPLDQAGFRGAVLLKRGQYRVNGTLKIAASGVVLRGEGPGKDGTVLIATLPRQYTVIEVGGTGPLPMSSATATARACASSTPRSCASGSPPVTIVCAAMSAPGPSPVPSQALHALAATAALHPGLTPKSSSIAPSAA
jgi:hypothetical protein